MREACSLERRDLRVRWVQRTRSRRMENEVNMSRNWAGWELCPGNAPLTFRQHIFWRKHSSVKSLRPLHHIVSVLFLIMPIFSGFIRPKSCIPRTSHMSFPPGIEVWLGTIELSPGSNHQTLVPMCCVCVCSRVSPAPLKMTHSVFVAVLLLSRSPTLILRRDVSQTALQLLPPGNFLASMFDTPTHKYWSFFRTFKQELVFLQCFVWHLIPSVWILADLSWKPSICFQLF